jgi:hypothetical protein
MLHHQVVYDYRHVFLQIHVPLDNDLIQYDRNMQWIYAIKQVLACFNICINVNCCAEGHESP